MGRILSLEPDGIEKRIHPRALEHFRKFQADVRFAVPLEELTEVDLNAYLEDFEKPKFQDDMNQIKYWLGTCIDIGDGDSLDNQVKVVRFKVGTITAMFSVKQLLEKVYDRKVKRLREEQKKEEEKERQQAAKAKEEQREREEKVEAERREKEEEERWHAAYKALKVPAKDASKYLEPEEHNKFVQSISGAIDAYLDNPESYLSDGRSYDYRWWCRKINYGREEEERKTAAEYQAREYNQRLNKEMAKVKSLLYANRKGHTNHFQKEIGDGRYIGQSLRGLLPSEDEQTFDSTVVTAVRKELNEIVSKDYHQFVNTRHWRTYFLLPSADYSFEGIPCLDFSFEVFAVVETGVWLQPGKRSFGDYSFNFPRRDEKGCQALVTEPDILGYHYLILTASDLGGYVFWQTIPLVLIIGLMNNDLEPPGTTIVEASEAGTTYEIKGFEDQVTIPESFASYMKEMGGIDQMVSMGILSRKVANIVEKRLDHSEVEQEVSLSSTKEASKCEDKVKRETSKKAKAFELFSDGKRPSDSEVKSLGIKPESAYRYYQAWKKANNGSNNYT